VAGASHSCALLSSGEVRCWGAPGRIGPGGVPIAAGATALAAGADHTCALDGAGGVRCWGTNGSGQLGDGTTADSSAPVTAIPSGVQIVAARSGQSCASTRTATTPLRCWGDSLADALADGTPDDFGLTDPQLAPREPQKGGGPLYDREVTLVAVGRKHVCVGDRGEAVECFGANERGQLGGIPLVGEAVTVNLPVTTGAPIATSLSAGADHTCAVVSGGRLRCWGANDAGQLGNDSVADPQLGVVVAPLGR
jgi:alpha-tubulin suppressor-like RCC1 family protein